jgi:hypothetical protein
MGDICTQAFINGVAKINCGSNVPGHIGWLDLNTVQSSGDTKEITISFDPGNAATRDIARWAVDGTVIDSSQIDLIKDGNWYLRYTLAKVTVNSHASTDDGGASATLQFASVSVDYRGPTATSATTSGGGITGDDFDC